MEPDVREEVQNRKTSQGQRTAPGRHGGRRGLSAKWAASGAQTEEGPKVQDFNSLDCPPKDWMVVPAIAVGWPSPGERSR